jgi:hypothetical protein
LKVNNIKDGAVAKSFVLLSNDNGKRDVIADLIRNL